jgi:hypothetical protein
MNYTPEQDDVRQVIKFAWLPRKVGSRTIWLRDYLTIQKFMYSETEGVKGSWIVTKETTDYWC